MAEGPGKYDQQATAVRENTQAKAVVVIVIGGDQGHGFSVQTIDPRFAAGLPMMLRHVAQQIENDTTPSKDESDTRFPRRALRWLSENDKPLNLSEQIENDTARKANP